MKRLLLALLFSAVAVVSCRASCVTLSWTAPGDDGMEGRAATYDIRYSTNYITNDNWDQAEAVSFLAQPAPGGETETLLVWGLDPNTRYYFALKTADEKPNWSNLSNVISKRTPTDVCSGITGNIDCSEDGEVDIIDLTQLICYLFLNGPICCESSANISGDAEGVVDVIDLTMLISYLFQSGDAPVNCQ